MVSCMQCNHVCIPIISTRNKDTVKYSVTKIHNWPGDRPSIFTESNTNEIINR